MQNIHVFPQINGYSINFHPLNRSNISIHKSPTKIYCSFNNNNNNKSIKSNSEMEQYKVAVVGSGNWGSVAAKLVASNTLKYKHFHDEVRMWVFDETLSNGQKLSNVINQSNVNVKYLPGVQLGKNVIADPDLEHAVKDANMLVFVTPHQFIEGVCKRLVGKTKKDVKAISLIKGMEVKPEGPSMISSVISTHLGCDCCVLMGANIANEIAKGNFSEATIGYKNNKIVADKWAQLFTTPYFAVTTVQDVEGVELCGTLKNVVAIGAGFVDGLDMGNNTKSHILTLTYGRAAQGPLFDAFIYASTFSTYKPPLEAAIMRIGLNEMKTFSKRLFPSVKNDTFFESCGVADLITTSFGGRNVRVAKAFAKCGGKRSFKELEAEILNGQKLQGVLTTKEVYEVLKNKRWLDSFPLFKTIHEICIGVKPVSAIVHYNRSLSRTSPLQSSL